MIWANNLFGVLLLTDLTGTIFFLAGIPIRKLTENDVVFLRFLMKATLYAYLVPCVYLVLYLGRQTTIDTNANNFNLFYSTPLTLELNAVLGCIWIGLFLALLAHRLYRRYRWVQLCKGNIPEEDERILRVFRETCAGLGIDGEVSLCRNDSVHVPCITRCHGYVVILPFTAYTEKEARVILCHELCHYLNGDLYFKTIGIIATLLHVFNPAVHILLRQMDLLCERCCDREACKKGKDRFTVREYFQTILRSLVNDGKQDRYQLFALADDRSNYERRVKYMVDYHKHGGLRRGTAVVLAVGFLLGSGITALAAGDGVTDIYRGVVDETSIKETDVDYSAFDLLGTDGASDDALTELSRPYDLDPEKVTWLEEEIEPYARIRQIHWKVPPGETIVSTGMIQFVGDTMFITVEADPDDIEYEMGIQDPTALMRYVEGTGTLTHQFAIDRNGFHYFYVTNHSETEDLVIDAIIVRIDGP